jgi:hypothetical protein
MPPRSRRTNTGAEPGRPRGRGRRGDASGTDSGMDVDAVIDRLVTTAPSDFTAARDDQVAAARAGGDGQAVSRLRALRRPTLAAWACNLLAHQQRSETEQFLELGEQLRRAYEDLDPEAIRALGAQQGQVISALARQAARLAREAGGRISDTVLREIESTLRAALTDPDAARQLAEGRLHTALTPPTSLPTAGPHRDGGRGRGDRADGAGGADQAGGTERGGTAAAQGPARGGRGDRAREREQARARAREERRAAAQERADAAHRQLQQAQEELEAADTEVEDARGAHDRARQELADLEQQLEDARGAAADAQQRLDQATDGEAQARHAVDQASKDARRADQQLHRLR